MKSKRFKGNLFLNFKRFWKKCAHAVEVDRLACFQAHRLTRSKRIHVSLGWRARPQRGFAVKRCLEMKLLTPIVLAVVCSICSIALCVHSFSVERGTAATHACGPWTSIWWSIIGATPRARRCAPLPCDMRYGVVQTVALHAMYTREHVLALGNITCAVLQLFAHRFRTCGCTLAGSSFWPELADRSLKPWVCTCLNPIGRKPKGSIELSGQGGQLVKGR